MLCYQFSFDLFFPLFIFCLIWILICMLHFMHGLVDGFSFNEVYFQDFDTGEERLKLKLFR